MFVKGFNREDNKILHKNKGKENNWLSKHWTFIPMYIRTSTHCDVRKTN